MTQNNLLRLEELLIPLYEKNKEKLLFHGWHHVTFVRNKAKLFAQKIGLETEIVESAALVHDLNYIVRPNSEASDGEDLREKLLKKADYTTDEILRIEKIILESHTATRTEQISDEGKALSDGDTLFKALPITSIFYTAKYLIENKVSVSDLAEKIIKEQEPLIIKDIYFYTDFAKQHYLKWAKTNIELWKNIKECLTDIDIQNLISKT